MQKWEYQVISQLYNEEKSAMEWSNPEDTGSVAQVLNNLGKEGWRLVSVVSTAQSRVLSYFFERPIEE